MSQLISREFVQRLAPKGVSFGQLPILLCLWKVDSITQKVLSEGVLIEGPDVVRTLNRMECDGPVSRSRSTTDRHQVSVRLTEKGRGLRGALVGLSNDVYRAALDGLGRAGQHVLDCLLVRLIRNLERDTALIE